jgi:cyclopropane fatty-acyl-phospholipid synthase-like methyltransferase
MNSDPTIELMPLYTHLDRIEKGLLALGIGLEDPIQPEQLFLLDQWHYHGTEAVQHAAQVLKLHTVGRVLDVGSGLGGPARFLAHTVGCHLTALELQPNVNRIAADLTRRCGLADLVTHVCGDALSHPLGDAESDAVVSWMALHHIPERPHLCGRLARAIRSGGRCYIEDLYMRTPFSPRDLEDVRRVLVGNSVTSMEEFARDIRAAGLHSVEITDLTADVVPLVVARHETWRESGVSHTQQYGVDAYLALEKFYSVIARLFDNGGLGCLRLVASKPWRRDTPQGV